MLTPSVQSRPLDFDISLEDFFDGFLRYRTTTTTKKIQYEYKKITIDETISTELCAQKLLFYPLLAKQIRKLKQLHYKVSIDLNPIESYRQKGLAPIMNCLNTIDEALSGARLEKSRLDARVNNLLYLYGQTKDSPILQHIKPYFHCNCHSHNRYGTRTWRLTISGVQYWLNYQSKRFGEMAPLYQISEYDLLADYFDTTRKDPSSISQCALSRFAGGILNTPIYAFLVRNDYKHKGRKHYIDLSDNTTYTRIADVREKTMTYTKKFEPWIIEE
ncbi:MULTISPECIES: hypothetical protein [Legionella]|uniref:Uncharacterized protein n=1 Tax=Legionella drozanskii LLAP-1 TaxID=1212489 RepID=A0A0W0SMB5_9GAMM|nr:MULTISPECIES: hypothetical protein [Legionella]KTC84377.1 hypothetical protein Ldro_2980 [Legionella drozanskii LLAP-1]PJE06872.1 MAG: hypothetical protein CK430_14655 [Legionella sp.]